MLESGCSPIVDYNRSEPTVRYGTSKDIQYFQNMLSGSINCSNYGMNLCHLDDQLESELVNATNLKKS